MLAEEAEPQPPQRVGCPAASTFISRPEMGAGVIVSGSCMMVFEIVR